jgi:heterodisulfide reductase subunit B
VSTGYYPGCSLDGTSREFGESLVALARALGADLKEIDDWSCCGASSAHVVNSKLAVALPARNLALAEAQGFDEVVAPCAACYNRLAAANLSISGDRTVAGEMSDIVGRPVAGRLPIRNVLELLTSLAPAITPRITHPLKDLRVACYYGCLLVRPSHVTRFDDVEQPSSMESLAKLCGATPVRWNMAVECCGGSFSICRTKSVIRLGRAILEDARRAGAQAIVVACPMCHSNLDFRQQAMRLGGDALPIVFVTELVGLAMGLEPSALGLQRHFVETAAVSGLARIRPPEQAPKPARAGEAH